MYYWIDDEFNRDSPRLVEDLTMDSSLKGAKAVGIQYTQPQLEPCIVCFVKKTFT